jgi:DNA mismatch repair ATPase MutS
MRFSDHDLVRHQAVLHEIATRTLPLAFFATHYGSLTDDFAYHPNIRNMHMSTMLDDEKHEASKLYTVYCRSINAFVACLPVQVG